MWEIFQMQCPASPYSFFFLRPLIIYFNMPSVKPTLLHLLTLTNVAHVTMLRLFSSLISSPDPLKWARSNPCVYRCSFCFSLLRQNHQSRPVQYKELIGLIETITNRFSELPLSSHAQRQNPVSDSCDMHLGRLYLVYLSKLFLNTERYNKIRHML